MATGENDAPLQPMRQDWRKRARAWLAKSRGQAWRPRKRHRVMRFQALGTLDRSIRTALSCDGLLTWQKQGPPAPPLELVGDSRPDNFCLAQFLQRRMELNIDFFPGPSHGAHRDMMAGLKKAGLWPHALLAMLAFNARHGPCHSNARLWQVRDSMREYFEMETASACPLIEAFLPGLIRDQKREDSIGENTAEDIWRDLSLLRIWERKGSPVNTNRFLGFFHESLSEDRHWWARANAQTYACISLDMMQGQQFPHIFEKTSRMRELVSSAQ